MSTFGMDKGFARRIFDELNMSSIGLSNKNTGNGYLSYVFRPEFKTFSDPSKGYISQLYEGISFVVAEAYLRSIDIDGKYHRPQPSYDGNVIRIENEDIGQKVDLFFKTGLSIHSLENDFSGSADKKREIWEKAVLDLLVRYGTLQKDSF